MGPLFSLLAMAMVSVPVGIVVLFAARVFMPWRHATLMAVIVPSALWVGFFVGALGQSLVRPDMIGSDKFVIPFLATSAATALLFGVLASYCVWRLSRR